MTELTRDDWFRATGSDFVIDVVHSEGETIEQTIRLAEVSRAVESSGFVSWSLLFTGPASELFEQGMATVRHDDLGEQVVFLVPLGVTGDDASYESVFSVAVPT